MILFYIFQASANTDVSALNDFSETLPPPSSNEPGKRKRRATPGPTPSPSPSSNSTSLKDVAFNALNLLKEREDRFSAYGEYVACELRTLPADRVNFVQRSLTRHLLRLLEAEELARSTPVSYSPVQFVDVEFLDSPCQQLD